MFRVDLSMQSFSQHPMNFKLYFRHSFSRIHPSYNSYNACLLSIPGLHDIRRYCRLASMPCGLSILACKLQDGEACCSQSIITLQKMGSQTSSLSLQASLMSGSRFLMARLAMTFVTWVLLNLNDGRLPQLKSDA